MLKITTGNSRCSWSWEETRDLLAIMKERNVLNMLNGRTRRNNKVYILMAQDLAKRGYYKNCHQVKTKFRTLKKEFYKAKLCNSENGVGLKSIDHLQDLEELFGEQPLPSAVRFDTTTVNDVSSGFMNIKEEPFEEESLLEKMDSDPFDAAVMNIKEEFLDEDSLVEVIEELENDPFDVTGMNTKEELSVEENLEEEIEEVESDVADEYLPSEPKRNTNKTPKEKRSNIQTTLLKIAAEIKESQRSILRTIKEDNNTFLREQRRLQQEYLNDTRSLMEEDRRETKKMLLEIFKN